jgi:hypothetical protein
MAETLSRLIPNADCRLILVIRPPTRSVFIRYAIVATKDIQNAMNALEKNDGTLMEPDAKLALR